MMRCKMCRIWKNTKGPNELSINHWKDFICQLKDLVSAKVEINFCGGEALLKDGFLDLIRLCSQYGFATSMTTCGFLIDEGKAEDINEAGLKVLNISLDSLDEEKHDFLRGVSGTYKRVLKGIDYLDKYRHDSLEIGIQTIISRINLDDILSLVDWVNNDPRLNVIYFQPIVQPYNTPFDYDWRQKDEYAFLWPDDIGKVESVIDELIKLKEQGYKISNPLVHLQAFRRYFKQPHIFIKDIRCDKGDHLLNVNNEGQIYLCYNHECLGNIRDDAINIKELWYSEKAGLIRNQMYKCRKNCADLVTCLFEEEA
jgi:MoaA/NifB/PqqE/SkfB family radical SAM enzyme